MRTAVAVFAGLVLAAGCGRSSGPSQAAKTRCAYAIERLALQVWIAGERGDYASALAACPWLSRPQLVTLTRQGRRRFLRAYRRGLNGVTAMT
jgi:hypothetical protein